MCFWGFKSLGFRNNPGSDIEAILIAQILHSASTVEKQRDLQFRMLKSMSAQFQIYFVILFKKSHITFFEMHVFRHPARSGLWIMSRAWQVRHRFKRTPPLLSANAFELNIGLIATRSCWVILTSDLEIVYRSRFWQSDFGVLSFELGELSEPWPCLMPNCKRS